MSMPLMLLLLIAQEVPIAQHPQTDAELATQRGGFMLPNGVDVALTVQAQTSLNGSVVLRSVFRADEGTPTLSVFAPKQGAQVTASGAAATAATSNMPTVTYDPTTGIQVVPARTGVSVALTLDKSAIADVGSGFTPVVDAAGAATDAGTITQSVRGGLQTAELRAADLTITHLAGTAFGTAIENSGSDRAIDTQTTIGLDLHNMAPLLAASAALRVENVANAAMMARQ